MGNIRSKTDGSTSHSYTYGNAQWADQLTAFDGHEITYDGAGNPLTYYNGESYTLTWQRGRQLAGVTTQDTTATYAYDMAGVRSSKTVNGVTYEYTTLSGKLMRQTWQGNELQFVYDASGRPYLLQYTPSGGATQTYYYLLNIQGDVVGLIDESLSIVVRYSYDPWGKPTGTTASSSYTALADANPLRYRSYYYDSETGFYYLQSRYYDPAICRFLNADGYVTTDITGLLSGNMYAYCENNPVMYLDSTGEWLHIAVGALVGGLVSGICAAVAGGTAEEIVKETLIGAAEGALCSATPALTTLVGAKRAKMFTQAAKTVITVAETSRTIEDCKKGGAGYGESVFAGATVMISSFVYGNTEDLLTNTVYDLTYGLGSSLCAQMVSENVKKHSGVNRVVNKVCHGVNNSAHIGKSYIAKPGFRYVEVM